MTDEEKESYHSRQVELDRQLQLHKDKDEAHAAEIAKLRSEHAAALSKAQAEVQAHWANKLSEAEKSHVAEIAQLKAEVLIPAQRDLHARQMADLQAKHQAELDRLK